MNIPATTVTRGVSESHSGPKVLPRFVRNLNALAEAHGFSTRMSVEPYSDSPKLRLWARWEGTKSQLISLGLLTPSQQRLLTTDCDLNCFSVPHSARWLNPLIGGGLTVTGDTVALDIDFGPPTYLLTEQQGVEVVTYPNDVLYHGTSAALIGAGIPAARLPSGKRLARQSYNSDEPRWRSRRQPDGLVVYCAETREQAARRQEKHEEEIREYELKTAAWREQREAESAPKSVQEWRAQMLHFCETLLETTLTPPVFLPLKTDGRFRLAERDLTAISSLISGCRHELQKALENAAVIDTERPKLELVH